MIQLNIASLLFALIVAVSLFARAEYSDPTTMVNVNKQTDLFEKSMDDWDSLQDQIINQKSSTLEGVKGKQGLDSISSKSQSEIKSSAGSLSSIKATDLNSRGTEELSKDNIMNDIYIDFSRPLNKQHMVDAKKLAKGQDRLMGNLLNKLREIGVDCKTVKGPVEKEPTYYLQIEKTQHKDTVYNKTICEELRNSYRCTDSVSLTCKRRGKGYGEWEPRKIRFNGHVLHNTKMDWGFAIKWKYKRWGWHISPNHPSSKAFSGPEAQVDSKWRKNPAAIIADARAYIALQLGVSIEQIGEHVQFPASGRGIGNIGGVGCRWRVVWDEYEFGYSYRDAYDTCEEWEEDWTERCDLDKIAAPVSSRSGERG